MVSLGGDIATPVISRVVTAGVVYRASIYDIVGNLYFNIVTAPSDGEWILTVASLYAIT
jgi:hypothetical protein